MDSTGTNRHCKSIVTTNAKLITLTLQGLVQDHIYKNIIFQAVTYNLHDTQTRKHSVTLCLRVWC